MSQFCECAADGFCLRYRREMGGRLRAICAGVDVDLGTAAAFREQWAREAGPPPLDHRAPVPLLLRTDQAPGDAVAMTAAVYSLHRAHPGKYATAVASPYPEVFAHNPDVVAADALPDAGTVAVAEVRMHYPAIHRSNERAVHFMQGWCEHLEAALGVRVPLLTNRPHLYFPDTPPARGDYWLVCSGGKRDFTAKLWGHDRYQRVLGALAGKVKFVQVGADAAEHPRLYGARYEVGRTDLRQLFDLCRRARGVLCGVSLLMHVAAALGVPAVVVAGGREPAPWNCYPRQAYLHTVGALPCPDARGVVGGACWRARVLPLGDGTALDRNPCVVPAADGAPACMGLLAPAEVTAAVLRYDGRHGPIR